MASSPATAPPDLDLSPKPVRSLVFGLFMTAIGLVVLLPTIHKLLGPPSKSAAPDFTLYPLVIGIACLIPGIVQLLNAVLRLPRVTADRQGLKIRRLFSNEHYAWKTITRFYPGKGKVALYAEVAGGEGLRKQQVLIPHGPHEIGWLTTELNRRREAIPFVSP